MADALPNSDLPHADLYENWTGFETGPMTEGRWCAATRTPPKPGRDLRGRR